VNYNLFWIAWLFLSIIQTSLFFSHWLKAREQQKKWDEHYKEVEEQVDTKLFLVYNNMAYWQEKNKMYRGKYKDGKIYMKTVEKVDPFNIKDISPAELFDILDKLKGARV
jgi:hypothetical protein